MPYPGSAPAYLFLLSDPVSPGLRLQVVLWVPVAVENDDSVCRGEIDPQTTGTGGQQEAEVGRVRRVEVVQCSLPLVALDATI